MRGAAGFGLIGRVVFLLASSQPVTAGLAFYGVGWSVYSHAVARGTDVTFAKNTPMEIRFATDEGLSGIAEDPFRVGGQANRAHPFPMLQRPGRYRLRVLGGHH